MKHLVFISLMAICSSINNNEELIARPISAVADVEQPSNIPCQYDTVTVTVYYPLVEQCWGDPFLTADMSIIDLDSLKDHRIRWAAISRDMHERYGGKYSFGDTILVHSPDVHIGGEWVIHDLMNGRFNHKIDLLYYPYEYINKIDNVLIEPKI